MNRKKLVIVTLHRHAQRVVVSPICITVFTATTELLHCIPLAHSLTDQEVTVVILDMSVAW